VLRDFEEIGNPLAQVSAIREGFPSDASDIRRMRLREGEASR